MKRLISSFSLQNAKKRKHVLLVCRCGTESSIKVRFVNWRFQLAKIASYGRYLLSSRLFLQDSGEGGYLLNCWLIKRKRRAKKSVKEKWTTVILFYRTPSSPIHVYLFLRSRLQLAFPHLRRLIVINKMPGNSTAAIPLHSYGCVSFENDEKKMSTCSRVGGAGGIKGLETTNRKKKVTS